MFRFTIRELVLLTIIVAMGLGWGMHGLITFRETKVRERQWRNQSRDLAKRLAIATGKNFTLTTPDQRTFNVIGNREELSRPFRPIQPPDEN